MNLAVAWGSSGFLSGWYLRISFLYAFLISFWDAEGETSKISYGSKDLIAFGDSEIFVMMEERRKMRNRVKSS